MYSPASQVVNFVSCQPTGVHEVDEIDSFQSVTFSLFVKSRNKADAAVLVASPSPA